MQATEKQMPYLWGAIGVLALAVLVLGGTTLILVLRPVGQTEPTPAQERKKILDFMATKLYYQIAVSEMPLPPANRARDIKEMAKNLEAGYKNLSLDELRACAIKEYGYIPDN